MHQGTKFETSLTSDFCKKWQVGRKRRGLEQNQNIIAQVQQPYLQGVSRIMD